MVDHSKLLRTLAVLLIGATFGVAATIVVVFLVLPQSERSSTQSVSGESGGIGDAQSQSIGFPDQSKTPLQQRGSSSEEPIENPRSAWSLLIDDDIDDVSQRESLIRVATAWIEQEGLEALTEIITKTDLEWEERNQVLGTVIRLVASMNPRSAFEDATRISPDEGGVYILSVITKVWIGTDPIAAMTAVNLIESRTVRRALLDSALEIWAKMDPQGVLTNLALIPAGKQAETRMLAIVALRASAPDEAMKLLSETKDDATRQALAYELVGEWAHQDVDTALNWVLFDPDIEDLRSRLLGRVIQIMANNDPYRAMQVALDNPKQEKLPGELDYDASVISQVASEDLNKALEMLSMAKPDSKLPALTMIGFGLTTDSEFEDAIDLGQHLTGPDQTQYYESIVGSWAQIDAEGLLGTINSLPTPQAKSKAAVALLGKDWFRGILTQEQRDQVKSFLTEEDAVEVENTYPDATRRGS